MSQSNELSGQPSAECLGLTPESISNLESCSENRAQIVIVSGRRQVRDRLSAFLADAECDVHLVNTIEKAHTIMDSRVTDLMLIDRALGETEPFDLCLRAASAEPGMVTILLTDCPSMDDALRAMRSGAVDLVPSDIGSARLFEHINSGMNRARHLRKRERRALRLRGLCLRLNAARQEVSQHVGELCSDLVEAYQDLSGQIQDISMSTELNSLLRQELDLECLLRTSLEYLLSKVGSTNAAIFLPSSSGEFSLGAYVNYDRSKDEAEVMLDHLACVLAPRFEHHNETVWMRDPDTVRLWLEEESHWLEDCETLIIPCHESGECLAVLVAFRDHKTPFTEEDRRTTELLGELFGRQLSRVINVHHRHMPKDEWNDDRGMAA